MDFLSNRKSHAVCLVHISEPLTSLPVCSADEEKGTAKVIKELRAEAIDNLGPKLGDWGLEFSERSLRMPAAAQPTDEAREGKLLTSVLKPFGSLKENH